MLELSHYDPFVVSILVGVTAVVQHVAQRVMDEK